MLKVFIWTGGLSRSSKKWTVSEKTFLCLAHLDESAGVDGIVISSDGLRLLQIPCRPEICPGSEKQQQQQQQQQHTHTHKYPSFVMRHSDVRKIQAFIFILAKQKKSYLQFATSFTKKIHSLTSSAAPLCRLNLCRNTERFGCWCLDE